MLTYQRQPRFFKIAKGDKFTFPCDVEIKMRLDYADQYGVGDKPFSTVVKNRPSQTIFSANTGKQHKINNPALEVIDATLKLTTVDSVDAKYELKGDVFRLIISRCENLDRLDSLVKTCYYLLPLLLNVEYDEPSTIQCTSGRAGTIDFGWEYQSVLIRLNPVTNEENAERAIKTFSNMAFLPKANIRLVAGLYYFYNARRLYHAGNTPYEFLSEIILNLSKTLEILFGSSRENVRKELSKLGYSKSEIERNFIPLMIMRNEFDVGHVSVALHDIEQLKRLYDYLDAADMEFRKLIQKIIDMVKKGSYALITEPDLTVRMDKRKLMDKLLNSVQKPPQHRTDSKSS